jgi:hypothetical protein
LYAAGPTAKAVIHGEVVDLDAIPGHLRAQYERASARAAAGDRDAESELHKIGWQVLAALAGQILIRDAPRAGGHQAVKALALRAGCDPDAHAAANDPATRHDALTVAKMEMARNLRKGG